MGISATCDGCQRDIDGDAFCEKCATCDEDDGSASADLAGDLAAAIRRGDIVEAEYLLDQLAADNLGWADRVSIGRYSARAKAA